MQAGYISAASLWRSLQSGLLNGATSMMGIFSKSATGAFSDWYGCSMMGSETLVVSFYGLGM